MGTRSTVTFLDNGIPLCCIYQQFDGYIKEGVGDELKNFVKSKPIVNGIGENENVFNGVGCMAAQFIKEFKKEAGGLYLFPLGNKEEYNYIVNVTHENIHLKCEEVSGYGEIIKI